MARNEVEVRTFSVPTAAHLLLMGYEPLGVTSNKDGNRTMVRFSAAAREALAAFLRAKQHIDLLLDPEEVL